jgi:Pyruvate/2-oxoacid:ferredoxin oxidoreductase gamma subunit
MNREKHRYFIELHPENGLPVPRWREAEVRRLQATHFIAEIGAWLKREALENKVATMAVTALGQVQITCEADVIGQIRSYGETNIAAIRPGASFAENLGRFA